MSGTQTEIRGPFESMDHCRDFKSATEEGDPSVSVACLADGQGRIFARITPRAAVPLPVMPSVNPDIPAVPPVPAMDQPGPIPAGPVTDFIAARRVGPKAVMYTDSGGRAVMREGGSRSWRNNNPGNIIRSAFAETAGAIGDDGSFAIFPSEKVGLEAIVSLLRTVKYRELSLEGAIFRYAPPSENDSAGYAAFVSAQTGIDRAAAIASLTVIQLRAIAKAIRTMEGWTVGSEAQSAPNSVLSPTAGGGAKGITGTEASRQEWMQVALDQAALPEHERSAWLDPGENPRILNYFRVAAGWFDAAGGDETDWCAAFVNFCLLTSGHLGTEHPGARSFFWNRAGRFVALPGPTPGAIAVRRYPPFDDPDWATGHGHVGFVTSFTDSHVTLLGGNQDNTVKTATYPRETRDTQGRLTSKFVAFMMPVMS